MQCQLPYKHERHSKKYNNLTMINCFFSANHPNSTFDSALCGVIPPSTAHSEELLAELVRLLKPGGKIVISEDGASDSVFARLKLSGFVSSTKVSQYFFTLTFHLVALFGPLILNLWKCPNGPTPRP